MCTRQLKKSVRKSSVLTKSFSSNAGSQSQALSPNPPAIDSTPAAAVLSGRPERAERVTTIAAKTGNMNSVTALWASGTNAIAAAPSATPATVGRSSAVIRPSNATGAIATAAASAKALRTYKSSAW